jgi:hypothetical protein
MAYVSQELKAKLAPSIRAVCKKYGVKASVAVRNHSTLVLNVKQGSIDFIENYIETDKAKSYCNYMSEADIACIRKDQSLDVNPYHYQDHFSGRARKFLIEVMSIMNDGNWDKSDSQTDYFNVGWYVDVNIGRWNKPYALEK